MGGDNRKLKDCIGSQEELEDYLKEKAKNHQTHRIYSDKLCRITNIVKNHYLYLYNISTEGRTHYENRKTGT